MGRDWLDKNKNIDIYEKLVNLIMRRYGILFCLHLFFSLKEEAKLLVENKEGRECWTPKERKVNNWENKKMNCIGEIEQDCQVVLGPTGDL